MSPSLVATGLIVLVSILVDFQTQNDVWCDDDAIDECMRLRCVDALVVDAIFSLSHVDIMLLEEAKECMFVFLARKTTRFVRVT
ncbi:hypothetical protein NY2A_b313L [Paramecium bursaria Chlorella virus NY2A]|uniref:Uncharacterized protein b313L n=1 Tax=Paramecium bursaria Chlorella virus NY2A TaxID=46021 RepID=A7IWI8_PBCVN|nr:hypothetical protein NY2A_b313L [Paramecium bursaria Chlorella virus NY2A]ABT14712.1 hypothetical protein NY2A_b313L [Paramecium bursaria Chlorella virus NY2A]